MEGKTDNHIFDWESGDAAATDAVFAGADVVVDAGHALPARASRADGDLRRGRRLGPGHRQADALVARPRRRTRTARSTRWSPGCPSTRSGSSRPTSAAASATRCRIYPGYVLRDRRLDRHRQAGEVDGGPLREPDVDRRSPATTTCTGEIAATRDGKILGLRVDVLADHGAFNAHRAADEVPGRLLPHLHRLLRPRGRALQGHRRLHQQGARRRRLRLLVPDHRGGLPRRADGRLPGRRARHGPGGAAAEEPAPPRAVPVRRPRPAGCTTPATTSARCARRCDIAGYDELRREQAEKRARGELMGIGICFFTEAVGAGPRKHMDILGLGMADGAELRVHPTGKAQLRHQRADARARATRRRSRRSSPRSSASRRRTSRSSTATPTTRRSASAPTGRARRRCRGAAAALVARKVRDKARIVAAGDARGARPTTWSGSKGRWFVKGDPEKGETIQEIAHAPRTARSSCPRASRASLDAETRLQPAEPDLSRSAPTSASSTSTRAPARSRCAASSPSTTAAPRINPMIVEGQVHGGLTDGVGMALMELIAFDEDGNCLGGSLMDYLIPTALEVPDWETGETVTPSPHHPIGAKGVGESATVGSPPAIVNAVIDALTPYGVRHVDMPCTPCAGVGGDAGKGGAAAVISAQPRRARASELRGRARAVRARRRSCAPQRPTSVRPGRRGDRARRRHDRGLRRRRLRARPRCGCTPLRALETGEPLLLRIAPGAGDARADARGRGRRAQPVPERRRAGDLPRAAAARAARSSSSATTPIARALARRSARALGYDVVRGGATAAAERRGASSSPRTAATRRRALRRALRAGVAYVGARREPQPRRGGARRARRRRRAARAAAHAGRPRHRRADAARRSRSSILAEIVAERRAAVRATPRPAAAMAVASRTRRRGPGSEPRRLLRRLPRAWSAPLRRRPRAGRGRLAAARAAEAAAALRRRRRCSTTRSAPRARAAFDQLLVRARRRARTTVRAGGRPRAAREVVVNPGSARAARRRSPRPSARSTRAPTCSCCCSATSPA